MQHVHGTETQETCTQYNILKVARYLFRWSGAPSFADFYERAILNGLFGVLRMPANYKPHGHDPARNHHTSSPVAPFARSASSPKLTLICRDDPDNLCLKSGLLNADDALSASQCSCVN